MATETSEFEAVWLDACKQFKEGTGVDLLRPSSKESTNSERIVDRLNDIRKEKDADDDENIAKAKSAVRKTLMVVQCVGSVAAQIASMVFGSPANIAMNGISAVIDAGFKYKNIAHNIDDLFSQIATIMERFQVYREHEAILDVAMIRVAHRLLITVVNICKNCVQVIQKKGIIRKIGRFLKVGLFNEDGGISSQFDVLRTLQAEELQIKATLTYVATKTNSKDLKMGFKRIEDMEAKTTFSINQLSVSANDQKTLKKWSEALRIEERSNSENEYRDILERLTPGACAWLKDDAEYTAWSNTSNKDSNLLVLVGDEGCGKSYTMTAIIRDLLIRYPQKREDANRTSIAYYFITRPSRKDAQTSKSGSSIMNALRMWAWQILNNDLIYRKDVQHLCDGSTDLVDLDDIWQKLFLNQLEKEATFFLLLDGTQDLEESEIRSLLKIMSTSHNNTHRLKIALTCNKSFSQKLISQIPMAVTIVGLRERVSADMKMYIQQKADTLGIFQARTPQVLDLKAQVVSGLVEAVNGSFHLADIKLREISGEDDQDEVLKIIAQARKNGNLDDSIREAIQKSNRTLKTREIEILNTLLLWCMYGEWQFRISELNSVLFLQQNRSSLQPLIQEINNKFYDYLELDVDEPKDPIVRLKYDTIKTYFKNLSKVQGSSEVTTSQSLTKGEISMAEHFIRRLCDQDMYDKLGLEDFFSQKLSQTEISIVVDCENAHARIALACLKVLIEESAIETGDLLPYALINLTSHLKAIDLDSVDTRWKVELGPPLVQLFTNPSAIERCNDDYIPWAYSTEGTQEVLRLFKSSTLRRKLNRSEEEWVQSVLDDAYPEIALLEDTMQFNARHWLTSENANETIGSFEWLCGYYHKLGKLRNQDIKKPEDPIELLHMAPETIEDIFKLVQEKALFEVSEPCPLRNLGVTYRMCGHIPEAITQLNKALEKDPGYLAARASLAVTYTCVAAGGPKPDWESALLHQDHLIKSVKNGEQIFSAIRPAEQLTLLLGDKALWLKKQGRYEESCEIYTNLIKENPQNYEERFEFISLLSSTECYDDVVVMFKELHHEVDTEYEISRLSRFFHDQNSEGYHSTVLRAFKRVGKLTELKEHYQQAIDEAYKCSEYSRKHSKYLRCQLFYFLAVMLYSHGGTSEDKEEAVSIWEKLITAVKTDKSLIWFAPWRQVIRRLASIYIGKAVEAGSDSAVKEKMLGKVQSFLTGHMVPNNPDDNNNNSNYDDDEVPELGLPHAQMRFLLGRYYIKVGEIEKAKEQLRPDFELGIELLSDDDPTNDYQGYHKLANAFMDFSDDDNALAAWSMIQPTKGLPKLHDSCESNADPSANASGMLGDGVLNAPNDSKLEPKSTISPGNNMNDLNSPSSSPLRRANASNLPLSGPLLYTCDGGCGTQWTFSNDMYVCRECVDVEFDTRCLEKHELGELENDHCEAGHKFLHVPPWDLESAKLVYSGKVKVGKQVLEVKTWLENIKRDWALMKQDEV